jgi:hypothetical protein
MPCLDDASRLLEFTEQLVLQDGGFGGTVAAERAVGRSQESRERLIFQGNTWRDISACIRSAVSAEVDSVDSISRNESAEFFPVILDATALARRKPSSINAQLSFAAKLFSSIKSKI